MKCSTYIAFCFIALVSACIAEKYQPGCDFCVWTKCNPSITAPGKRFHPIIDAIRLRAATEGLGTNEDLLIKILTRRTEEQRLAISKEYRQTGRSLFQDVIDDTSFGFRNFLKALVTQLEVFYTKELRDAVISRDRITMVEIFVTLPPCVIRRVVAIYPILYKRYLSEDIVLALKDYFNRIDYINVLLLMAQGKREQNKTPMVEAAIDDAELLQAAMTEKLWTRKKYAFMKIFTQRSIPQLLETFNVYESITKSPIDKDIFNTFESSVKEIYVNIIRIIRDTPQYFARALEKILSKDNLFEEDEKKLIRIVRGRCDIDLEDIKRAYREIFKQTVVEKIVERTNVLCDYKKALIGTIKL